MSFSQAIAGASTLLSVLSTVSQASAQLQEGKSRQAALEYNARIQEQQAAQIEGAKKIDLAQTEKQKRRRLSTIRAQAGAFGGTLAGSPLEVLSDTVAEFEIDKTINAFNFDIQKTSALAGASLSRFEGAQARAAGKSKAFSTILTGVSKFASGFLGSATTGAAG